MNDRDELKLMFRERLDNAELPVSDGLWDELQGAIGPSALQSRHWNAARWMKVAASLLLFLGVASALLWWTQPNGEETPLASAEEVENMSVPVDRLRVPIAPSEAVLTATPPALNASVSAVKDSPVDMDEDEEEMVHLQVTIRIQEQGHVASSSYVASSGYVASSRQSAATSTPASESETALGTRRAVRNSSWALKAGIGTSLGKGDAKLPFTVSLTAEHKLNKRLAVEAGLQYHCLPHRGTTYHTLELPLRLQCLLATSPQFELYALAGGSAEKCVAGAPSNSFSAEPVRLAVQGGIGVRYRLSDQLALFAEPTLSHHFSTDSANASLRTERPTNFNLLCGLRMNY